MSIFVRRSDMDMILAAQRSAEVEQPAKQPAGVGLILLPCRQSLLVILVDQAGVVGRRNLRRLVYLIILAGDLRAGQKCGDLLIGWFRCACNSLNACP